MRLFIGRGGARAAAASLSAREHLVVLGDPEPQTLTDALGLPTPTLPGLYRLNTPRVTTLTLGVGEPLALCAALTANVDHFELHQQPETQHAPHFFRQLARLANPGATLAIPEPHDITVEHLIAAGFVPSGSERGLCARYRGGVHRHALKAASTRPHAIIIGAGLAGSAIASRLAARNWQVDVIEAHPQPAQEASGNLAGVISPMLSRDDNRSSRLSRASFFYLLDELRALEAAGSPANWSACGVVQLAKREIEWELLEQTVTAHHFPEDFCRLLNVGTIERKFGFRSELGGVFFPQGGWVNPPSLCRARLNHPNIKCHYGVSVGNLEHDAVDWRVIDAAGHTIARSEVVILANGPQAARLAPKAGLHLKPARGQVTHLTSSLLPLKASALGEIVLRDGYLTPAIDGLHCLGATYDFDTEARNLDIASHQKNLARLAQLSPDFASTIDPNDLPGRVGFRALTIDRLPLVGALPDLTAPLDRKEPQLHDIPRLPGLYGLLGLGSRGLVWSALAGEFLSSLLCAEPLPIADDLKAAIDPARFVVRGMRST